MKRVIYVSLLLILFVAIWTGCNKEDDPQYTKDNGSIIGAVTDFATGEPIINANVQLRPTGETTLTGTDGTYEFKYLPDGKYSITVSKAEYKDLIDTCVIDVKKGKTMRRDVQIEKVPTYIIFTDMQDNVISELDFGEEPSITTKMFNVFNHGTVKIRCQKVYSCNWITSVSDLPAEIEPGQIVQVSVSINRSLLSPGINTTILAIKTNNGSNEITLKATSASGNPPSVQISSASEITSTSAKCSGCILNPNGSNVTDCGFCYSTSSSPTLNDDCIRLGPKTGAFSFDLVNLEHNTTYHVKAFATSILGTGYSSEITFTTVACTPNCGATSITNIDAGHVNAQSTISIENGCSIVEAGICWSSNHTPTINDEKISHTDLPLGYTECGAGGMLYPLEPNTTYRARSYAKNEFGDISYGPEKTFTTLTGLATVTTSAATLSGDYIITGGNATENANTEGTTILVKGVCYGSSPNPDLSNYYEHTGDDYGSGQFTSYIPTPSYSGYIYIRAYATTHFGTAYGNQVQIYIP